MELEGFKKHVLPLHQRLFHYAYLLLKDKSEAEDAVQEVCLKLWKIRQTLEMYTSIEAFAIKVTRNWCLDRLKSKKPVYIESYLSWHDQREPEGDPLRKLEFSEKMNYLFSVMAKLPEQQRMIIQLRDIEEREFDEIAEIMDMNVNAIRVNLSRARNRIREEMTQYQ
jgi:RNA polymerase sigma factor (sigma-70 family)